MFRSYPVVRFVAAILFFELILQIISLATYTRAQYRRHQAEVAESSDIWALQDPVYSAIYQEESDIYLSYRPFTGWRMRELHTPHINVDASGIRHTTDNPEEGRTDRVPKIYMFGGSAMWGEGLPDEHTIPSLAARERNSISDTAVITNYGEIGYGSSQNLMQLIRLLSSGNIPDVVVWLDGCNDMFLNVLDNTPHETFRDTGMRQRLGNIWKLPEDGKQATTVRNSSVFGTEFLNQAVDMLTTYVQIIRYPVEFSRSLRGSGGTSGTVSDSGVDPDRAALRITDAYIGNVQVLEALSEYYGFDYYLFWQPTLFTKRLIGKEQNLPDARRDDFDELSVLYRRTGDILTSSKLRQFTDLSALFAESDKTVFTDSCHVTADGNTEITREILSVINSSPRLR